MDLIRKNDFDFNGIIASIMTKIKSHKKIGLFGGTFDPVHLGHIHCARQVLSLAQLDQIELIPSFIPPHRSTPEATADDRLAMLELAIRDEPHVSLNPIEIQRADISYTIDTLKHRSQQAEQLFLILGQDAFLQFHCWKDWQEITRYCDLIILNRPGYPEHNVAELLAQWINTQKNKITWLQIPPSSISATDIRHALKSGASTEGLLDSRVAQYIREKGLYQ